MGLANGILAGDAARVISRLVWPKGWQSAGGQGMIEMIGYELLVQQTQQVCGGIAELLRGVFAPSLGMESP